MRSLFFSIGALLTGASVVISGYLMFLPLVTIIQNLESESGQVGPAPLPHWFGTAAVVGLIVALLSAIWSAIGIKSGTQHRWWIFFLVLSILAVITSSGLAILGPKLMTLYKLR